MGQNWAASPGLKDNGNRDSGNPYQGPCCPTRSRDLGDGTEHISAAKVRMMQDSGGRQRNGDVADTTNGTALD